MKRKIKTGIVCVLESLIPAVCCYLGQSNNALKYLQEKNIIGSGVNIALVQDFFSWLSVITTFLLLTVPLAYAKIQAAAVIGERDDLICFWKNVFIKTLEETLGVKNLQINIRIFVPRKSIWTAIKRRIGLKYELYFKIRNYPFLADKDITEGLELMVYPNPEGLVGRCYQQHTMQIDNELETTNDFQYNLKEPQKQKTRNLKFSIVCPIFNSSNSDEVIAIMAYDCNQKVYFTEKSKQKELEDSILNFTQLFSSNVPDLFK